MKRIKNGLVFALLLVFLPASVATGAKTPDPLPAPQLVKDAWMFIAAYKADPEVLKDLLPKGLEPHPDGHVVMNMYTVPKDLQTSGFGKYSLTYLTIELKGRDSYVMDRDAGYPGRYFVHYFNSSEKMRKFAKKAGIPAESGETKTRIRGKKLRATLKADGKTLIKVEAKMVGGKTPKNPESGHLNYFGMKGRKVVKYPIPYIGKTREIKDAKIKITAPKGHPLHKLKPLGDPTWAVWMKASFVYPQFQNI